MVKELVLKANGLCPREFELVGVASFFFVDNGMATDMSAVIAQLGER